MRKGIIFTTDAILALIAVMILLAMIPMQAGSGENNKVFENLNDRARDEAITGLYTGIESSNTSINSNSEFGKCAVAYDLDPDNALGARAEPQKKVFCEEA